MTILSAFTCERIYALLVLMEDIDMLRNSFPHIPKFIITV